MQNSSEDDDARGGEQRKRELPPEAVSVLKAWLMAPEHFEHPYPSPQDQQQLLLKTGIGKKQLKNWFTNARRRIWKPLMKKKQDEAERQRASNASAASGMGTVLSFDRPLFHTTPLLQQHWAQALHATGPAVLALPSTTGAHSTSQLMQQQQQHHHHQQQPQPQPQPQPQLQSQDADKLPSIASFSTFAPFFEEADDGHSSDTTGETQERSGGPEKRAQEQPRYPAKRRSVEHADKPASPTDKLHDDDALDFFHSTNTTDLSASEYETHAASQDSSLPRNMCVLCRQLDVNVQLLPCHCRFHAICLRECLLRQEGPPVCPRCRASTSRCEPLPTPAISVVNDTDIIEPDVPNDESTDAFFPQEQELYQTSHTPPSALTEDDV